MTLVDFISLVNQHYLYRYNTQLLGGFSEPLYLPAQADQPAQIQFSYDYFRSALHELAHWCEAGVERRKKVDYGYWYAPDGRNQAQQQAFFQHEIVPQAFEWALSIAAGVKFEVSVDNLTHDVSGIETFQHAVTQQLEHYLNTGFPERVDQLLRLIYQARGGTVEKLYAQIAEQMAL